MGLFGRFENNAEIKSQANQMQVSQQARKRTQITAGDLTFSEKTVAGPSKAPICWARTSLMLKFNVAQVLKELQRTDIRMVGLAHNDFMHFGLLQCDKISIFTMIYKTKQTATPATSSDGRIKGRMSETFMRKTVSLGCNAAFGLAKGGERDQDRGQNSHRLIRLAPYKRNKALPKENYDFLGKTSLLLSLNSSI